jgi:hypothetical protein
MGASESKYKHEMHESDTERIRMDLRWNRERLELIKKVDIVGENFFTEHCAIHASDFASYDVLYQAYIVFARQHMDSDDLKVLFYFRTVQDMFETALAVQGGTVHAGRRTVSGVKLSHWPHL